MQIIKLNIKKCIYISLIWFMQNNIPLILILIIYYNIYEGILSAIKYYFILY